MPDGWVCEPRPNPYLNPPPVDLTIPEWIELGEN